MRLTVVCKNKLTEDQSQHLARRIAAPEHKNDRGPIRVWDDYTAYLYAFIHIASNTPIAIAEASGRPCPTPGWWIDSQFRGQGLGNEVVDLLAEQLKVEGVTALKRIPIDTYCSVYDEASSKLAKRMHAHFKMGRA